MTPTGQELKFKLLRRKFAKAEKTPGEEWFPTGRADVPFYCFDITPRNARIPYDDATKTTHPCGATGIHSVEMLVPKEYLSEYLTVYGSITGSQPIPSDEGTGWDFKAGAPVVPPGGGPERYISVRAAETEGEMSIVKERGVGIGRVSLAGRSDGAMVPKGELGTGMFALRLI